MLTTPQAAERLGVSTARIRQFILEGRLKSQQFGRDHLIKESDLAPFLGERKAGRPKKDDEAQDAAEVAPAATAAPSKKKPATKPRSAATLTTAQRKKIMEEQQRRWAGAKAPKKGGKQ